MVEQPPVPVEQHPLWSKIALWIIAVLIVLGNSMVCAAFITNKRLRTITNHFVVSLAIGDLLAGGLLLPMYIIKGNDGETTAKISGFIFIALLTNICGCTYDRFVAIHHALRYHAILTKKRIYIVLSAIWLLPTTLTLVHWLALANATPTEQKMYNRYYVGIVFFGVLLTCFVLAGIYFSIFRVARRHVNKLTYLQSFDERQNGKGSTASTYGANGRRRFSMRSIVKEVKATKLFAIIGLTFILCWLPLIYINIVYDVFAIQHLVPLELQRISAFTIFVNSLIDPTIYAFFQTQFRKTFKGWAINLGNFSRKDSDKNQNIELRSYKNKKTNGKESASLASNNKRKENGCIHGSSSGFIIESIDMEQAAEQEHLVKVKNVDTVL